MLSTVCCILNFATPTGGLPATDTILFNVDAWLESYNATTNTTTYQQIDKITLELLAYNNTTGDYYYTRNISMFQGTHSGTLATLFTIPENLTVTDLILFATAENISTGAEVDMALTDINHNYTANFTFKITEGKSQPLPQPIPTPSTDGELFDSFVNLVGVGVFIIIVLILIWGFKKIFSPIIEE